MTQREAKMWACGQAAALLRSDMDGGEQVEEDDPDYARKMAAMKSLVIELQRRSGGM